MGKIFDFLGISVGCITNELDDIKEKKIINVILLTLQIMN